MTKNTTITLTPQGLQKLKDELAERTTTLKEKLASDIEINRENGDVSENEGFEQALDNYASNEARIGEIEHTIANATIIKAKKDGRAALGEKVTVKTDQGKTITYELVGDNEADPLNNKITDDSPIGSALNGNKKGDKVDIELPTGKVTWEILSVE
jgi:transcription elongation factor GreA